MQDDQAVRKFVEIARLPGKVLRQIRTHIGDDQDLRIALGTPTQIRMPVRLSSSKPMTLWIRFAIRSRRLSN